MGRDIQRKSPTKNRLACRKVRADGTGNWFVAYRNDQACWHHVHVEGSEHNLCGPVVFCCPEAAANFDFAFPANECFEIQPQNGEVLPAVLKELPADQVISWLDAGIQVVNFIFCDSASPKKISAAVLSGKDARQALSGGTDLPDFGSQAALESIGSGLERR